MIGIQAIRRTLPLLQNNPLHLGRSHNINIPLPNSNHQPRPPLQPRQLDPLPLTRRISGIDVPHQMDFLGLGGDCVGHVAEGARVEVWTRQGDGVCGVVCGV